MKTKDEIDFDVMLPNKPIPPDPDDQNDDRSDWAEAALVTFAEQTGTDEEDAVADLLCDLMHFCDRHGLEFRDELARGEGNYEEETGEERTGSPEPSAKLSI
jgi:hypothetical protein